MRGLLTIFLLSAALGVQAQTPQSVMGCSSIVMLLPDQPALLEYLYNIPISNEGDVWLDYPGENEVPQWGTLHGWKRDVTPELRENKFFRYGQRMDGQWIAGVWIQVDPTHSQDVYLFVFNNLKPYALPDGRFYGSHPCGSYIITQNQLQEIKRLAAQH